MKNRYPTIPNLFLIMITLILNTAELFSFEKSSSSFLIDDNPHQLSQEFYKMSSQNQIFFPGIFGSSPDLPGDEKKTLFGDNKTLDHTFFFEMGVSPVSSLDYGSAFNLELNLKLSDLGIKYSYYYGSEFFDEFGEAYGKLAIKGYSHPTHDYPRQTFVIQTLSAGYCSDMNDLFYSAYLGIGYIKGTFRGEFTKTIDLGNNSKDNYYNPENIEGLCLPLDIEFGYHYNQNAVSLTFSRFISSYKPIDTFHFNFILFIF